MRQFDDALLEDDQRVADYGDRLSDLALLGARLRLADTEPCLAIGANLVRPRAIIALGAEARLLQAVVETQCPVPFVAWMLAGLPTWTSALDLVVLLDGPDLELTQAADQAVRRGAQLMVVAPADSGLNDRVPATAMIGLGRADPLVEAAVALTSLATAGLGPALNLAELADAVDQVAAVSGPRNPLGRNPAKDLACALADSSPLVWGAPGLAARAARRVAGAIREATGWPALAADESALMPLIAGSGRQDLFADPIEQPSRAPRFSVLLLQDDAGAAAGGRLWRAAQAKSIRVETIETAAGHPLIRYAEMLQQGLFAAAYLDLASVEEC